MKKLVTFAFLLASAISMASEVINPSIRTAIGIVYTDEDAKNYVCLTNPACDVDTFSAGVTATKIDLGSKNDGIIDGLLIEPSKPGRQYFSALFVKDKNFYRMVFSPDVTLSGLNILSKRLNGMPLIRSSERESNESWVDFEYAYFKNKKAYSLVKKLCYKAGDGASPMRVKCPSEN